MRIHAFIGARGPGGNTSLLLDLLLEQTRAAGAETGRFSLLDHPVASIADCRRCDRYHGCTNADQGAWLIDRMLEADTIVVASPIYWGGPSAQLKAFLDRWSCVPDGEMKRRIAGKRLVGLTAYGNPDDTAPAPFRLILENLAGYFSLPSIEFLPIFCDRHGDADTPDIHAAVAALAARMVHPAP